MANTINDYPAANTIDATNDYFLLEQSSAYKKINRSTILGITGSPVGTSDSQALTNKTIGNTNTVALKDTLFTLQDDGDTTKQAVFQLSGITTGTTRTLTIPDANTTLVGTGATQTLTNKTLTSPTISGGTIDNATITVDSISGHSVGTTVTVANLQIANGVLNTANAVTATSIAAGAVQPQALVSGTGSGWSWSTWSPTYANLTVGNGTVDAHYIQIGKTVTLRWFFKLGSTSSVGSGPTISFPVAPLAAYYTTFGTSAYIGQARLIAGGVGYVGFAWALTSTTFAPVAIGTASTYAIEPAVTATVPGTWTTGDVMFINATYETA